MPDHAHLILALGTDTRRLGTVIGSLKAASAREINRVCGTTGSPLWQRGYYDHVIRDGCALPLRQPHNDREQATLTAASPRDSLRDPRRQRSYDCFTAKLYYSIVYSMKTPARFVTMQARGLIALPHDLRARHGLDTPGAQVEVLEREDGVIELRPHIAVPADQAWFWSARWQALERVVDEHVARGETETFETSEDFLSSLDRFPGGR